MLNPATGAVISTGNALDGDYDGIPGASPTTLGLGGYEHRFTIESDTTGPGPIRERTRTIRFRPPGDRR